MGIVIARWWSTSEKAKAKKKKVDPFNKDGEKWMHSTQIKGPSARTNRKKEEEKKERERRKGERKKGKGYTLQAWPSRIYFILHFPIRI